MNGLGFVRNLVPCSFFILIASFKAVCLSIVKKSLSFSHFVLYSYASFRAVCLSIVKNCVCVCVCLSTMFLTCMIAEYKLISEQGEQEEHVLENVTGCTPPLSTMRIFLMSPFLRYNGHLLLELFSI